MNPGSAGMGAGAVVSVLFLGGLFVLMGYFVWKAYQRPRQDRRSFLQEESGDSDSANEDNDPERSE